MPISMKVEGLQGLMDKLNGMSEDALHIGALALYDGAGVVADEMQAAAFGVASAPFEYAPPGKQRLPSPEEVGLIQGKVGIAKFSKDGVSVQTSVGYQASGYGTINGKSVPIPKIANAINSGTSFMKAQPFMRKAARAASGRAQAAIVAKANEEIEKRLK